MKKRSGKWKVYFLIGVLLILSTVFVMQHLKKINIYKEMSDYFEHFTLQRIAYSAHDSLQIIQNNLNTYTVDELNRLSEYQSHIIAHYRNFFQLVSTENNTLRADPNQYYVIRNIDTRLKEERNSGEQYMTLSDEELKEIDQFKHICENIWKEYESISLIEDKFILDRIRIFVENLTKNSQNYLLPYHR